MNRAENVYEFRRVNMHGTKTGAHADPDYHEKYHPGDASYLHHGFGLSDGKHRIMVKSSREADPNMPFDYPGGPLDVYINPSEKQMKRLADPDDPFAVEMRFMVHRDTGDLIAWEAEGALHTQVTEALLNLPAWAADDGTIDLFSDFTIPAATFYEGIEHWIGPDAGKDIYYHYDFPDDHFVVPKILRRNKP
jgi:hypothetical protein